ncbi:LIRP-like isoform X2 [Ceratina calcarata]|nr:LIRP-like isoform X2 [Ceratina calcarata]XP_026673333.1 LIRP-like isoform X2 [Ceratina calcarata]
MSSHALCSILNLMLVMAILMPETEHTPSRAVFQYDGRAGTTTEGPQKYCGNQLPQKLQDVCEGIYHTKLQKSNNATEADDSTTYNYDSFPYTSAENANRIIKETRGGISDECCRKSCTIQELQSYCGKPEERVRHKP